LGGADKFLDVLQAWGLSDTGPVRATNEDRFAIDEALQLCVVADGMGGHKAGEIAALTAVEAVLEVARDRRRLGWPFGFDPSLSEGGNLIRTAIYLANMRVLETAGTSTAYAGMGTTLVAALVVDGRLSVGHVGDSRLYRLAGSRLRQLTGDDSWMAAMIASDPGADASLLQYHPMRHVLTAVVGSRRHTEVHVVEETLAAGDRLLLSTDGVHGVLDDRRLEGLLLDSDDLTGVASEIVRTAIARGSRDNCTAVVAEYQP
jgi:protein phosphatase